MFTSCFGKKNKEIVPTPQSASIYAPISAKEAQEDALKKRNNQKNTQVQYLEKNIIPQIWKKVYEAKGQGHGLCGFDDDEFKPRITLDDYEFISRYFEDPPLQYEVDYYRYDGVKGARFRVHIRWEKIEITKVELSNEQSNPSYFVPIRAEFS
jgi:hypothetical protein